MYILQELYSFTHTRTHIYYHYLHLLWVYEGQRWIESSYCLLKLTKSLVTLLEQEKNEKNRRTCQVHSEINEILSDDRTWAIYREREEEIHFFLKLFSLPKSNNFFLRLLFSCSHIYSLIFYYLFILFLNDLVWLLNIISFFFFSFK